MTFITEWSIPLAIAAYLIVALYIYAPLKVIRSNSSTPSIFPVDPRVSSIRCQQFQDLALLYRFHRARVERDRNGRSPTLDRTIDAQSRLQFEHRDTYGRLVEAGYFTINEAKQCYVPTYKGAYLMTYRLLPPFRQIQMMRRARLADRALRELGFGGMTAFQRSQFARDPNKSILQ